jgi:hypothetical protein
MNKYICCDLINPFRLEYIYILRHDLNEGLSNSEYFTDFKGRLISHCEKWNEQHFNVKSGELAYEYLKDVFDDLKSFSFIRRQDIIF